MSEVGRAEGVLFHPDVGSEQGWGHFRECVAVGRELSSAGVRCGFALPSDLDVAHSDAASEAFEVTPFRWGEVLLTLDFLPG